MIWLRASTDSAARPLSQDCHIDAGGLGRSFPKDNEMIRTYIVLETISLSVLMGISSGETIRGTPNYFVFRS
jgi:hypothetical protein